jgi:hypothetical protein
MDLITRVRRTGGKLVSPVEGLERRVALLKQSIGAS